MTLFTTAGTEPPMQAIGTVLEIDGQVIAVVGSGTLMPLARLYEVAARMAAGWNYLNQRAEEAGDE